MAGYNPYEINSGFIFSNVYQNWKKYDRNFLATTFKDALEKVLHKEKIFTAIFSTDQEEYFRNYREFRYEEDMAEANEMDRFPFPDYFFLYKEKSDKYPSIISYDESLVITRESIYFDLFFALMLSETDIMKADNFLNYHLQNSFEENFSEYKIFLENVLIKYNEFLRNKLEPIINRFITNKTQVMEKDNKLDNGKNAEHTTARQVLAMHYILGELGVTAMSIDRTEIARFIQFLTGKELNAKDIKNTNIYKRVGNLLSHSEKSNEADLQYIRNYFEKIGLVKIAEKISKEIASKE